MSSINNKEKNFISAVVYLHNEAGPAPPAFCRAVAAGAGQRTSPSMRLVAVDDACTDDTVGSACAAWRPRPWPHPLTMLHMSLHQGLENAHERRAWTAAIGDYVYEFDSIRAALPGGADLPTPTETALQGQRHRYRSAPAGVRPGSGLFYRVFNANSAQSVYHLRTDAFRLVTRRAINRVHAQQRPPALPQGGLCGLAA